MDNFSVIYKILKILEAAMDCDEFDTEVISYKKYDITKNRWKNIIEMLYENGYIKGVIITKSVDGSFDVNVENIKITLLGLEYLAENTMLKKAHRLAKGVKDIPFVP